MFVIDNNGNIMLTHGDTADIQLTVVRDDGTTREFKKGDIITMTVKKSCCGSMPPGYRPGPSRDEPVMVLRGNKYGLIRIKKEDYYLDSEGHMIPPGNYVFDVQLDTARGERYTVVPTRTLSLVRDVTKE